MRKEINLNEMYDWVDIQKYYDDNKTWRDVTKKYGIGNSILSKANKLGYFKSRTRSDATKISLNLNPRTHTEETKKKISDARIKYLRENPDKVPYKLNHSSKGESYPEKYFREILEKTELIYKKEECISSYRLDFAFYDNGIDLEIDGDQHYLDDVIVKSNKRRDKFLKELGWEVVRVKWSDYMKMNKENKDIYIDDLIDYIKNKSTDIPKMILENKREYYCECGNVKDRKAKQCLVCHNKQKAEKSKIVPYEQLKREIEETNYSVVGKKYGVSDTTIRKWLKKYEKDKK